ncbi:hypothetical protein ACFOZ7_11430 [Natribaculum luteum]|uniref:Uncharacterized protein n=1 Tax=Natribaculum luteum TaxID=1586232 RepID=A0ABD5P052_9EURY|nr:hypothetical protein [Natribaculum luteum]
MVHDAVQQVRDATRRAIEAGAKALEAAERGIDETMSALVAWCTKHSVDVDDRQEARVMLRLQGSENVKTRLNEAYRLWTAAAKDPDRFGPAQLDLGEREKGAAWRWL